MRCNCVFYSNWFLDVPGQYRQDELLLLGNGSILYVILWNCCSAILFTPLYKVKTGTNTLLLIPASKCFNPTIWPLNEELLLFILAFLDFQWQVAKLTKWTFCTIWMRELRLWSPLLPFTSLSRNGGLSLSESSITTKTVETWILHHCFQRSSLINIV